VFVCFQASIERQFEVIQRRWVADGDPFGCDSAPDLLLGPEDPEGRMLVPGDPPRFLMPQPALVTTRGGGYYFVPGLRALRAVAGSGAPRTSQTSGARASGA
jgi:deferrochelatase/peroxidase EfeB